MRPATKLPTKVTGFHIYQPSNQITGVIVTSFFLYRSLLELFGLTQVPAVMVKSTLPYRTEQDNLGRAELGDPGSADEAVRSISYIRDVKQSEPSIRRSYARTTAEAVKSNRSAKYVHQYSGSQVWVISQNNPSACNLNLIDLAPTAWSTCSMVQPRGVQVDGHHCYGCGIDCCGNLVRTGTLFVCLSQIAQFF